MNNIPLVLVEEKRVELILINLICIFQTLKYLLSEIVSYSFYIFISKTKQQKMHKVSHKLRGKLDKEFFLNFVIINKKKMDEKLLFYYKTVVMELIVSHGKKKLHSGFKYKCVQIIKFQIKILQLIKSIFRIDWIDFENQIHSITKGLKTGMSHVEILIINLLFMKGKLCFRNLHMGQYELQCHLRLCY